MAPPLDLHFCQLNIFGNIDFRRADIRAGPAADATMNIIKGQRLIFTQLNIAVDVKRSQVFRADFSAAAAANTLTT